MDFYNQDNYSFSDIENLIKNEVEESIHLDYKEARALGKDDPKKAEITKDVSAFANANGGIIVYGIAEANHKPKEITPIDGKTYTKEWLENIIQQIQPRINGVKIFPIRIDGNIEKSVYIVQIPRSANAPHMAKNHCYYKRINFQSVPMEDYEVRDTYNRVTTPNLVIDGCTFYKESEDAHKVIYSLSAAVLNQGNRACESYKLNFYINNVQYCNISHQTVDIRDHYTVMEANRIKLSSFSKEPIFPNERLDMGRYQITVEKRYNEVFHENLVIHMILFYVGGKKELAFIPSTKDFVEGEEKIIKELKKRML
ncbi:MAG: ATP-binding protein [Paludibacteraceae bacterium]|nr:ATP-binding protein [Paludibacteraceae bacterium]